MLDCSYREFLPFIQRQNAETEIVVSFNPKIFLIYTADTYNL